MVNRCPALKTFARTLPGVTMIMVMIMVIMMMLMMMMIQVKAVGNDICDVVERYMKRERKKGGGRTSLDDIVELTSDHVVVVKTRGSCKFRYGVQQQIRVDQIPLTTSI